MRSRFAGSNATLHTSGRGNPELRGCQVLPRSSDMTTPAAQPATAMRPGVEGSKAMSYRFRPTPRLPLLSKLTPQSVEANRPPPCVDAIQKHASCGDCSMCNTWKPAAPTSLHDCLHSRCETDLLRCPRRQRPHVVCPR